MPVLTRQYYVYILTNRNNTVLYTGVTNDLKRRVYEHKQHLIEGFSSRYKTDKLIYYEGCSDINAAIAYEKQLKQWLRQKKIELIQGFNPEWKDLYETL
jgi:putative endonuclease